MHNVNKRRMQQPSFLDSVGQKIHHAVAIAGMAKGLYDVGRTLYTVGRAIYMLGKHDITHTLDKTKGMISNAYAQTKHALHRAYVTSKPIIS